MPVNRYAPARVRKPASARLQSLAFFSFLCVIIALWLFRSPTVALFFAGSTVAFYISAVNY